jgi:hypothetical protein
MASFTLEWSRGGVAPRGMSLDTLVWVGGRQCIGSADRIIFTLFADGAPLWQAAVLFPEGGGPFVSGTLWEQAGVAAVGGGGGVFLLDLGTGTPRSSLAVDGYFGSFVVAPGASALYVLGQSNVLKLGKDCTTIWTSAPLAVDGLVFERFSEEGDALVLSAELDPPGGWRRCVLDARTGVPR